MIMKATHLYGQDDQPRKNSLIAPIVQGLTVGGIACRMLTALVAVLRYGLVACDSDPINTRATRSADSNAQHGVRLSRMRSLHSQKRAI